MRRQAVMRRTAAIRAAATETPATLCVFDVLSLGSRDLRALPQGKRKEALSAIMPEVPGLQSVPFLQAHGEALFAKTVELDIEGVVAKRLDAPYAAGRRVHWLKIKNRNYSRQEALAFRTLVW